MARLYSVVLASVTIIYWQSAVGMHRVTQAIARQPRQGACAVLRAISNIITPQQTVVAFIKCPTGFITNCACNHVCLSQDTSKSQDATTRALTTPHHLEHTS